MNESDLHNATDTQLLTRYHEGRDQSAFGEIIRRHGPMVWATAWRMTRSKDDSDDAFQATFFSLARSVERLRDKEALAGWLHRAAQSAGKQILRGNGRWDRKAERMRDLNMSQDSKKKPTSSLGDASWDLGQILDDELAALPQKIQVAVVLCDLEGLSRTAAANQLGIGRSTVDDHVVKGRRMLRERLLRRGITWPTVGVAGIVLAASNETSFALTEESIRSTTENATLYAAGKSAAEIGVSTNVIQLADTIVSAMTTAKLLGVFAAALAILVVSVSVAGVARIETTKRQAKVGTLFVDDFNDTDHADGSPVNWTLTSSRRSTIDISLGQMVLSGSAVSNQRLLAGATVLDHVAGDVSARARAKVNATNGGAAVVVRSPNGDDALGYFAAIGHSSSFGGSFAVAGVSFGNDVETFFAPNGQDAPGVIRLGHDIRKDFTDIQIDVVDNEINVWFWRAEERMPDEPLFTMTDLTYSEPGRLRVTATKIDGSLVTDNAAIFDSVHLADMPIHELRGRRDENK